MWCVREVTEPRKRRLSRDERRARIEEAAAEVFARRGYDGASLEEIAEGAGISKPVIYDHFESKGELYSSLLERQSEQVLAYIASRVTREQTAEGRMRAGIDAFLEFMQTHPFAWRMFFRDPPPDPEIAKRHREEHARARAATAALIAADSNADAWSGGRDWAVEALADLVNTTLDGLAAWWYDHPEIPRAELVALAMEFAWVGLERALAGERWPSSG
jgi:AcrR family transcriptional regulator